ncbi:Sensory box protein [Candidatus Desulfosporosinus infrequens]|uniref:histidine kinase n=1 Tax=Candidatus Desulfosporosinus infrequens TaxID=2043169 RepID=A0A2U3LCG4_9FIRM|nr:Sensory box protein [Candidatus Desulfosporosinus infrequens]
MSTDEVISELTQKITFLEEALAEVREDNEIWERIFTENYWGMVVSDVLNGELLKVNPRYAEMIGYSTTELIGKSIYDVYAPEYHQGLPEIFCKIHERGHYAYKSAHRRKDGSSFPVHIDSYEVTIKSQRMRVVSIWDITESEQIEKELSQYRESLEELVESRTNELEYSNDQLRSEILQREAAENELAQTNQEMLNTLESINDCFVTVNRQWIITYANKSMLKALEANGFKGDFIGSSFWEIYKQGNQEIFQAFVKAMNDGQPTRMETFANLLGHWAELSIYPTESGVSAFSHNIDERKEKEKAVQEEHNRLYSLFDSFPGLIFVQEENYKIRFANSRFQAKFGLSAGRTCYDVIAGLESPCQKCVTSTVFGNTVPLCRERFFDNRIYEKYIQPFTDVDGSKLIFKVLIDITDRKNADRELARLDRLNMVGKMAAGIAHEVRNPLTTVHGFLQLLAAKDDTKQYHEFYKLMIEELERANLIITDFLSLASNKTSDFELINISRIVRSLAPLLAADALNQDKEICLELEQVTATQGNENELRQLLLNLARNGLEAMQGGSTLTIQTLESENYIILRVCDQGGGIDPMILEKIGTPFLTTKERGTGLGLAICQSIAAHHNAVINYESSPTGTTVTVKFPVSNFSRDRITEARDQSGNTRTDVSGFYD